jgi:hypothetical protein
MRDWWLRTLLVLQRPRPVFVALRESTPQSLGDRSEPVLAIVLLAGIAGVLSTPAAGHLMDDPNAYDAVEVLVWAFIAGSIYGGFAFWVIGGLLDRASKALGSEGTWRRSRHVVAFAAVPIALSLVLWPVKLALFGGDLFRRGGSDAGASGHIFSAMLLVFVAWSAVLLVTGVRAVHGWTWGRAGAACALAIVSPVVLWLVLSLR